MAEKEELGFSRSEIETLIKNRVWKKIVEDALSRALILSEDNDVIDPFAEPTKIAKNQGAIANLKWIVDLPMIYIAQVEDEIKEEKEKKL